MPPRNPANTLPPGIFRRDGARGTTYGYTVSLPRRPDGRRDQRRRGGFPTIKAARQARESELVKRRDGAWVDPSRETLAAYLDRWLLGIAATVKPATLDRYRRIVRTRIVPALGGIRLDRLRPADIQAAYGRWLAAGLAPATVRLAHAVLRRALGQAVRWQVIPRNPCDAAEPPRLPRREDCVWSPAEARAFLATTADDDLAGLWALALRTGMRLGELLALRWTDVDLEAGTLAVRRTVTRDAAGGWTEGAPKGGRARVVALGADAVAAVRRQRARQAERRLRAGPLWQDHGLVFDRGDGAAPTHQAIAKRFKVRARRAGVPPIRFHDLRHSAATLLLAEGVHPKLVSDMLGHATVALTLDRYSHVTAATHRTAADALDRILGEV